MTAIAFIALIAVGADYNLLLALRIKQEATAGIKTAIVRTFGGTGGVITTAGIVFGLTMLAVLASIAQIGTTIAVGLLIDTRSCGHSSCRPRWRSWAIGSSGPAAFLGAL